VSGYHVEYSSMPFALFFLGEYANIVLMSAMTVILFFGGWLPPFIFLFFWIRATFPRFRYDQLMRLGWKVFLPLSLFWLILTSSYIVFFDNV